MANNNDNLVSYDSFRSAALADMEPPTTVQWNGIEVVIKKNLSLIEALAFVDNVVTVAFNANGEYLPERVDAAVLICTLGLYTNIDTNNDIELMYDLINGSSIFDLVMDNIDRRQFDRIIGATNKKIDNLINTNIQAIAKQVNDLSTAFESIETNIETLFNGIKAEDINGIINALSSGEFNEKKLVEAIANSNN